MNVLRLAELDVPNVDVSLRVSPHDVVGLAGDGVYGAQAGLRWNLHTVHKLTPPEAVYIITKI